MKRITLGVAILFLALVAFAQQVSVYNFSTDTPTKCPLGLLNCTVAVEGGSIRFAQDRFDPQHKFSVYVNTTQFGDAAVGVAGTLEATSNVQICSPAATFTLTIADQPLGAGGTVNSTQYLSKFQKSYGRSTACQWQVLAGGQTTASVPIAP
jgi:hypothetical protein